MDFMFETKMTKSRKLDKMIAVPVYENFHRILIIQSKNFIEVYLIVFNLSEWNLIQTVIIDLSQSRYCAMIHNNIKQ